MTHTMHDDLRSGVRQLAAKFPELSWREHDEADEFPFEFSNAVAEVGWLNIAIPEKFGGGGMGITEASILGEEMSATGADMNGCSAIHLMIFGLNTIAQHGSPEPQQEVLQRAATGDLRACFGVTEPDAGTETTRASTRAVRDGDYVFSGRKVWLTNAGPSEKMVLICRTASRDEATKPTDGMSLFLVDLDDTPVSMAPIPQNGPQRSGVLRDRTRLTQSPCQPPNRRRGRGFKYLLDELNPERILLAHESLGLGRAGLRKATDYAKERIVFNRPIGKSQGVAFPLPEAEIRLRAADLMANEAAHRYDEGLSCGAEANMATFLSADAGLHATDQAIQILGGIGLFARGRR